MRNSHCPASPLGCGQSWSGVEAPFQLAIDTRHFQPRLQLPILQNVPKPDAAKYNPDPEHLRRLVDATGLSQVKAAERIGVSQRTMRAWLAGDQTFPYTAQFALEALATSKAGTGPSRRKRKEGHA